MLLVKSTPEFGASVSRETLISLPLLEGIANNVSRETYLRFAFTKPFR
jgi:hypothetical protein